MIEFIVKMAALGAKSYYTDKSNLFDFVIVVLSSADVVLQLIGWIFRPSDNEKSGTDAGFGTISQVFRVFRLMRVFKLARSWTTFNYFIATIVNTIKQVGSFSVLLYLFIFTFTILGMELFSNTLRFNYQNENIP